VFIFCGQYREFTYGGNKWKIECGFLLNTKMQYKRAEGQKVNKMEKLGIMEKMREHVHFKIAYYVNPSPTSKHKAGDPNYISGSCMFRIDIRPPGGLMHHEAEKLKNSVLNANWIDYYAIGLEGDYDHKSKHMHISIVTNAMTKVAKLKHIFYPLLDKSRIDPSGKLKFDIAMKIQACPMHQSKYKTPMAQMAYVLKGAAGGKTFEQISPDDYNDGETYWTDIFQDECLDTDESREEWRRHRIRFAQSLVETEKKHKHKAPYVISEANQNDLAEKYANEHGLTWTEEDHASILATMVTDTDGHKQYIIGDSFGWKKKTRSRLNRKNKRPNYKQLLQDALQTYFDSLDDEGMTRTARDKNNLIKALKRQNEALVKERQELNDKIESMDRKIEEQSVNINKLQEGNVKANQTTRTLKTTLHDRTKELYSAIWEALPAAEKKNRPLRLKVFRDDPFIIQQNNRKYNSDAILKFQEDIIVKWRSRRENNKRSNTPATVPPTPKRQKIMPCPRKQAAAAAMKRLAKNT